MNRTNRRVRTAMITLLFGAGTTFLAAESGTANETTEASIDRIVLTDGNEITAPILKETEDTVYLDLPFEVLAVPRTKVKEIFRAGGNDTNTETASSNYLYSVAQGVLPERTPRDLADELGAAVIKVSTPSGLGSGFIVHEDGFAITNAHVIQGETNIKATVFSEEGQQFHREIIEDIEIVAVNDAIDLALIKLTHPEEDGKFPIVLVEGGDEIDVGEDVFAIGNPLGLERTLSTGTVSTTNRGFFGLAFIQTTAEINPGNSGGPLFNLKGEVVGCTNMGALFADGIGFAIPARYIRDFIRNHEAFAYDKDNPNSGRKYQDPPERTDFTPPSQLNDR
ncbi:MAG: trypsin-like peptidase domain-containing protein [Planctomycetota bacterium]